MKRLAALGAIVVGLVLVTYLISPHLLRGEGVNSDDQSALKAADQNTAGNEQPATAVTETERGKEAHHMEKATFGAGCFWGVEATFRQIEGVVSTQVGFMGGTMDDPSYKDVCYKNTGHAEVVEVTYDPERVNYEELLNVFWENHDPTQYNRQGPDIGDQYRSVIFYYTPEQEKLARASKEALTESGRYKNPIVTDITPATTFWRAEEYHQQYLEKRGLSTCHIK